ncbi:hypothetical protein [Halomonas sp. GD1P12]|uniref:hypothetical protein n=1 Tax=Halomonas sp. GD1P12 TaxID=2982691 RepID=UPI0021E44A40|nr:hypothetical protein [Halomonas sp. GD1P12]UYG00635.1 hypothetical protein OCT39_03505 [Halomonas sp. GD1P12]
MSKAYEFILDRHQARFFFTPIRKKQDAVRILLESIKIMLIYEPPGKSVQSEEKLFLKVSKMSRLVFESSEKIFTINFPFKVIIDNERLKFLTANDIELDNLLTSEALAFISRDDTMHGEDIFDFASPILDSSADNRDFWLLIRELFFYEDGYLRVDHDEANQDKDYHPLNHFDFFYSSNATFKIGLDEKYTIDRVIDILDITTPCHYLKLN